MRYPLVISSFEELLTLSFRYAWQALRQIFLLLVIWVALKALYTHLPVRHHGVELLLGIMIAAIGIFLWVIALYRIDDMLKELSLSWRQVWQRSCRRLLMVYAAAALIVIGMALIFLLVRWLVVSVLGLTGITSNLIFLAGIMFPWFFLLLYTYLAIPLLTVGEFSLGLAFYHSLHYAQQHFWRILAIYVELAILIVIVSVDTGHGRWLLGHHLMEVVDLLACSVILPLAFNLTLLLVHDLRMQVDLEQSN